MIATVVTPDGGHTGLRAVNVSSPAALVLVNLEDLWLEAQPQNVPGTWRERPNWQRKARYDRETLSRLPDVLAVLRRVDRLRRVPPAPP